MVTVNSLNHIKLNNAESNGLTSENSDETDGINGINSEESTSNLIMNNSSSDNFESALSTAVNSGDKETDKGSTKKNIGLDPADLLELVADEGLLAAIKICADWLHGESDIIKACGQTSHTLLSRFVTMLNLINVDVEAFVTGKKIFLFLLTSHCY